MIRDFVEVKEEGFVEGGGVCRLDHLGLLRLVGDGDLDRGRDVATGQLAPFNDLDADLEVDRCVA